MIIKNPMVLKQLPKDANVFNFRSWGISKLEAAIGSLVEKPWREKPAKIEIRNAIGPIVHVTPSGQQEEIIRLYKAYRQEPSVREMIKMGWMLSLSPHALKGHIRVQGERGILSKGEAGVALEVYLGLIGSKTRKVRQKKPLRKKPQRRPR